MSAEIVPVEGASVVDGDDDSGVSPRQVKALETLAAMGKAPHVPGEKYDSSPQVRALQMVAEGRLGGPNRGQGRPKEKRAAEGLSEHIRDNLQRRMRKALTRALRPAAGERVNLEAIRLAMDIEHKEASLQLKEQGADIDKMDKEQLLAEFFQLVTDAQTSAVIEGSYEEISDAEVIEDDNQDDTRTVVAQEARSNGDSPDAQANGNHARAAGRNGRGHSSPSRPASANPFTQAALRRAAKR